MNPSLRLSMRMAFAMGIFLPILETVRRINQILIPQYFIHWFDDYILGAILLWSAWTVYKGKRNSGYFLIVAWGIAVGVLSMSFLYQIDLYINPGEEPGIFSKHIVAVVKGLILAYIFIGLSKSIRSQRDLEVE
ncbi:MAG TPA: hypothetical protein VFV79_06905 [Saprospiraceae bacterium]|nr:hypothetical protein [Saprospiraceae bacterium]